MAQYNRCYQTQNQQLARACRNAEVNDMSTTLEALERRVSVLERKVEQLERTMRPRTWRFCTIDELKEKLSKPPQVTDEDVRKLLSIIGIAEGGPPDLSERMREYLYGTGDKK